MVTNRPSPNAIATQEAEMVRYLALRLLGFSADNRCLLNSNADSVSDAFERARQMRATRFDLYDMQGFVCTVVPYQDEQCCDSRG